VLTWGAAIAVAVANAASAATASVQRRKKIVSVAASSVNHDLRSHIMRHPPRLQSCHSRNAAH